MAEGGGTVDIEGAGDYGRDVAGIADMVGGKGDWGSYGGFNGINTGNKVMDAVIGSLFGGLGIIDRLAGVSWGDGVAGRGSSNNPTDQGASAGGNELADIIRTIIERGNEGTQTPVTANPNARGEGGRRPGGSSSSNLMRFPNRSGGSTLRRGPPTRISNPPIMSEVGGSGFRQINPQLFGDVPAPTGSINQMLGPNASTPPVDLSKMFNNILASTNQAVQDRSGGLNYLLGRGVDRGDFALDDNAATAVNPVLMQGRNQALQSLLSGSRVSDNIFDLSNLGANIGAKQGAQNIDVRGRIPMGRGRRY